MWLMATRGTYPAFPKPDWQQGNPKDVPHVERPHLHGPARLPARKAVVVAKCKAFWPEMVGAMNYEHVSPDSLLHAKTASILHPSRLPVEKCLAGVKRNLIVRVYCHEMKCHPAVSNAPKNDSYFTSIQGFVEAMDQNEKTCF